MTGWQTKELAKICEIAIGRTPPRDESVFWDTKRETSNVWLSIADLASTEAGIVWDSKEYISAAGAARSKMVKAGTLLLSFKLTLGRLAIAGRDLYTNEAIAALTIRDPQQLDQRFLRYFLVFFDWQRATDGDVKLKGRTFNKEKLSNLPVVFPPLPEQERIVDILDVAFEGIATAKTNAELNRQNARSIFHSRLQLAFGQSKEVVALSELAVDSTDGDHSPPPKAASGIPFITISNILKETRSIDFTDTFAVSDDYYDKLKPNRKPKLGDVLYTVTGATLGIPVLVDHETKFCFQRHIGLIRPKSGVDSRWLSYAMLSPRVFRQATEGATGAAQKTVSLSVLRNLKVPRLSVSEQLTEASRLAELEGEMRRLVAAYSAKVAALDALKQSLLHQAFTGKL